MANINFRRGKYKNCQTDNIQDSVYFALDANTIMMNGKEYGSYPKNFSFPTKGEEVEKTILCKDVNVNLQSYSVNTDVDFANGEYLQLELDLSTCSQSNNIELVSIGADITTWSAFEHTLRFFYSHNKEYVGNNNLTIIHYGSPKESDTSSEILTVGDTLTIKLSKKGLYINGVKRSTITASVLSDVLALTNVNIGSARSDDGSARSDAVYSKFILGETLDGDKAVLKFMPNQSETSYIDFPTATQTQCGVMSIEDKVTLDTLSEGNNDYGTY